MAPGDAPEMFDFVEEALDEVALFIELGIEGRRRPPIGLRGSRSGTLTGYSRSGPLRWRTHGDLALARASRIPDAARQRPQSKPAVVWHQSLLAVPPPMRLPEGTLRGV